MKSARLPVPVESETDAGSSEHWIRVSLNLTSTNPLKKNNAVSDYQSRMTVAKQHVSGVRRPVPLGKHLRS